MKKIISILLLACFAFGAISCGEEVVEDNSLQINESNSFSSNAETASKNTEQSQESLKATENSTVGDDESEASDNSSVSEENSEASEASSASGETSESQYSGSMNEFANFFVRSLNEFNAMKELSAKSDEELTKYMLDNSPGWWGIYSTKDIDLFFKSVGSIDILHIDEESGYKFVDMTFYPEQYQMISVYSNGTSLIRLISSYRSYQELNGDKQPDISDLVYAGTVSAADSEVDFYNDPDFTGSFKSKGYIATDTAFFMIQFSEPSVDSKLNGKIYMTTINEIIEAMK